MALAMMVLMGFFMGSTRSGRALLLVGGGRGGRGTSRASRMPGTCQRGGGESGHWRKIKVYNQKKREGGELHGAVEAHLEEERLWIESSP